MKKSDYELSAKILRLANRGARKAAVLARLKKKHVVRVCRFIIL